MFTYHAEHLHHKSKQEIIHIKYYLCSEATSAMVGLAPICLTVFAPLSLDNDVILNWNKPASKPQHRRKEGLP